MGTVQIGCKKPSPVTDQHDLIVHVDMFQCAIIWLVGVLHCLMTCVVMFFLKLVDPFLTTHLWNIHTKSAAVEFWPIFFQQTMQAEIEKCRDDNKPCL